VAAAWGHKDAGTGTGMGTGTGIGTGTGTGTVALTSTAPQLSQEPLVSGMAVGAAET